MGWGDGKGGWVGGSGPGRGSASFVTLFPLKISSTNKTMRAKHLLAGVCCVILGFQYEIIFEN